ncbi:MAG: peptidoglycan DD-metalloendopeptidase family protein [Novosphingobium sp.]
MTNPDSFDPRSWIGPVSSPAPAAELPQAWRAVRQDESRAAPPKPPRAEPRRAGNRLAPLAVSAAVMLAGAGAAWLSRPTLPAAETLPTIAQAPVSEPSPVAGPQLLDRTLTIRNIGAVKTTLISVGVPDAEARAAAAAAERALAGPREVRLALLLRPRGAASELVRMQVSYVDGSGAVIDRGADGAYTVKRIPAKLTRKIKVLSGELDSESFYSSAVTAGVTDTLIPEFINAFAFDFNLASEVKRGDTFVVAYEQSVSAEDEPVGQPQLLFASLTTPAKSRALYRFQPPGQEVGWFDGNGASTVRSFMRTPIDGARITSKFGLRFHPVLHYTRLHGGVDFAAPVGTPIYAAGNGTISSASPSGCAGNMVIMRHDNGWESRYFHLSRYADGLRPGQPVSQGFTIGYVGNTGTCTTGPHLHYEVHVEGRKVDPLTIKTESGRKGLTGSDLAAFIQQRNRVDLARAQQRT